LPSVLTSLQKVRVYCACDACANKNSAAIKNTFFMLNGLVAKLFVSVTVSQNRFRPVVVDNRGLSPEYSTIQGSY